MSPLDEETIEASLTRINAGLQSAGSPEVFEQFAQGVYLNKPFGRSEQALEVTRALGVEQGYTRVEQDEGPDQNDQYWVRLLKPNEITNDMIPNAAGVMDQMRRLDYETQQEPEPAEPQSRDVSAATPSEEVVSTDSFKEEASLTRINAGLQSAGSPEVFEQFAQGVYLNKPFGALSRPSRSRVRWAGNRGMLGLSRKRDPTKTINIGSDSSNPTK